MSNQGSTNARKPGSRTDKNWRPGKTLGKQNSQEIRKSKKQRQQHDPSGARLGTGKTRAVDDDEATESSLAQRKRSRQEDDDVDQDGDEPALAESDEDEAGTIATKPLIVNKGKRQNRKTGGTGKKQKVFVEAKNDMLNLAALITGETEEKSKAKLDRVKQRPAPAPAKDPKVPSKARQQQMDAARKVVTQRNKQKKENKIAEQAPPPPKLDDGKKRVSFA
ncbi:uncharacterized protein JCM15063_001511 [Sporobolomyces koalae]|uniref:uncharacterized protein n=1 Tax=Sporobolomyces koalae TaxID=500713 RepID=UPI003174EA01